MQTDIERKLVEDAKVVSAVVVQAVGEDKGKGKGSHGIEECNQLCLEAIRQSITAGVYAKKLTPYVIYVTALTAKYIRSCNFISVFIYV
jgi:hypothetical protein